MSQIIEEVLGILHEELEVPSNYMLTGSEFFQNKLLKYAYIIKTSEGSYPYEHMMDFLQGHFLYFRIGDIMIANETLKPILGSYAAASMDIIFMSKMGSFMENPMILPHSVATLYAISRLDLAGKNIIENGAADGILSVVSKKRGARNVYPIEIDSMWEPAFKSHLMANSLAGKGLILENIETYDPKKYFDCESIDIVYSTLGPAYGSADIASINALDNFPNAQSFILAGIKKSCEHDIAHERLALLASKGFRVTERVLFDDSFDGIAYVLNR